MARFSRPFTTRGLSVFTITGMPLVEWLSTSVREIIVYRSTSTLAWTNLAFEDWILKNVDLASRRILFLWQSSPCVVIGRHQNPWLESNIPKLRANNAALVRRRSGGGAVYHDLGNLNCTVFTHREDYSRPRNLWLVCDALNRGWGTSLHVNNRDDIISNNKWKVSGSSAKLIKNSAYHHFTLLLDVNTANLKQLLRPHPQFQFTQSSATQSTRSEVINLRQLHPSLTYSSVCQAIADRFYDVHEVFENRQVVDIDPASETVFPGITAMADELKEWDWIYGKTPKFKLKAEKQLSHSRASFTAEIERGHISSCKLHTGSSGRNEDIELIDLIGCRFWRKDVEDVTSTSRRSPLNAEVLSWILNFL